MKTVNHIQIAGEYDRMFDLAADVSRWPDILPHYRWVRILDRQGQRVTVEMAARHKGLPLRWRAIQTAAQEEFRIHYTHIGGITRGMAVDWIFEKTSPEGACPVWHVQIQHEFKPHWPLIGPWVAEAIIGKIFVQQVANKTLQRIKELTEGSSHFVGAAEVQK